jgi:transposase
MVSRRKFTRDFKRKVVEELDSRPVEELCREYELHKQLIYRWKREYQSNPADSFSGNGKIWKEDARIAQLERKIGQQAMIIDLLKKKIALKERFQEEERRKKRCIE